MRVFIYAQRTRRLEHCYWNTVSDETEWVNYLNDHRPNLNYHSRSLEKRPNE